MYANTIKALRRDSKRVWGLAVLMLGLQLSMPALAFEYREARVQERKVATHATFDSRPRHQADDNGAVYRGAVYGGNSIRRLPEPGLSDRWIADGKSQLRSKSEVVNEVKRRYNARVIKISLNSARTLYRVRILLPSGKVRNINVNARK